MFQSVVTCIIRDIEVFSSPVSFIGFVVLNIIRQINWACHVIEKPQSSNSPVEENVHCYKALTAETPSINVK